MTLLHKLSLSLAGLLLISFQAQAVPLTLTPGNADKTGAAGETLADGSSSTGYGPNNCEPDCINDLFGTSFSKKADLLYKSDVTSGAEEGSFSDSYFTVWAGSEEAGNISLNTGQPSINCIECYLAVKDGKNAPNYYFFDLSSIWNGTDTIALSKFWPDNGGISHASIWGSSGDKVVPEPGTLALLSLGAVGLVVARRRRRA